MLLQIIHQEETLVEMQDFYVYQRVSIFHLDTSESVFFFPQMLFNAVCAPAEDSLKVAALQCQEQRHDESR